jgi:hypothetical protein
MSDDDDADSFIGDVNVVGDSSFVDGADTTVVPESEDIIDTFVSPMSTDPGDCERLGGGGSPLVGKRGRPASAGDEERDRSRSPRRRRSGSGGASSTADSLSSSKQPPPCKKADQPFEISKSQRNKMAKKEREAAAKLARDSS